MTLQFSDLHDGETFHLENSLGNFVKEKNHRYNARYFKVFSHHPDEMCGIVCECGECEQGYIDHTWDESFLIVSNNEPVILGRAR